MCEILRGPFLRLLPTEKEGIGQESAVKQHIKLEEQTVAAGLWSFVTEIEQRAEEEPSAGEHGACRGEPKWGSQEETNQKQQPAVHNVGKISQKDRVGRDVVEAPNPSTIQLPSGHYGVILDPELHRHPGPPHLQLVRWEDATSHPWLTCTPPGLWGEQVRSQLTPPIPVMDSLCGLPQAGGWGPSRPDSSHLQLFSLTGRPYTIFVSLMCTRTSLNNMLMLLI